MIGGEVEDYKVTVAPAATAGPLSGWVFEDNGIGATAHDGLKGLDEPGLPNVPVTLYHDVDNNGECTASDPVLAETTTDGDGAWQLVAALADVGKNACLLGDHTEWLAIGLREQRHGRCQYQYRCRQ